MDNKEKTLKFTNSHEWVALNEGEALIGISKHAEQLLGDLVFVELPEIGQKLEKGQEMAVVESVKAASDVYAPLSGEIIAVNEALIDNPALINEAPYDGGWLVKLKVTAETEIESLLSFDNYEAMIAEEA